MDSVSLAKNITISVFGLCSAILTVIAIVIVHSFIDLNLFTVSIFGIIPVGAIIVGMSSSSGYYLGGLLLQLKPHRILVIQILILAALTQLCIYYAEYYNYRTPAGAYAKDFISFNEYLTTYLETVHFKLGRSQIDMGEAGQAGYWFAALQLIGFAIGGYYIFNLLKEHPTCDNCGSYYISKGTKARKFEDPDSFTEYFASLFSKSLNSSAFRDAINLKCAAKKNKQGTVYHTMQLFAYPNCREQSLKETVQVYNGKVWTGVPSFARHTIMPAGTDISPLFHQAYLPWRNKIRMEYNN